MKTSIESAERIYGTFDYQLLNHDHQATLDYLGQLSPDELASEMETNPKARAVMVNLIDASLATEEERPCHVVELAVAGMDNPFHLALTLNPCSWLNRLLEKAKAPADSVLHEPVVKAIRQAQGNIWMAVTHQFVSLDEALRIMTARTLELVEHGIPLVAPMAIGRSVAEADAILASRENPATE